jgi:hypothetical protein
MAELIIILQHLLTNKSGIPQHSYTFNIIKINLLRQKQVIFDITLWHEAVWSINKFCDNYGKSENVSITDFY